MFVEVGDEAVEAWRFVVFHIVDGVPKFGDSKGFIARKLFSWGEFRDRDLKGVLCFLVSGVSCVEVLLELFGFFEEVACG